MHLAVMGTVAITWFYFQQTQLQTHKSNKWHANKTYGSFSSVAQTHIQTHIRTHIQTHTHGHTRSNSNESTPIVALSCFFLWPSVVPWALSIGNSHSSSPLIGCCLNGMKVLIGGCVFLDLLIVALHCGWPWFWTQALCVYCPSRLITFWPHPFSDHFYHGKTCMEDFV